MNLPEWRLGRNFVRPGDVVKVLPPADRRGTSFEARVEAIVADDSGDVKWLEVRGGSRGRVQFHAVRPDRIKRVAQIRTDPIEGKVKRERKR